MLIAEASNKTAGTREVHADLVIVGNGIAGMTAAIETRKLERGMRIVIVTEQNHPTINTPVLKQFAVGGLSHEQLVAYPLGTERVLELEMYHARVTHIRSAAKEVVFADGTTIGYQSLLLATGSHALELPATLPGYDLDGVLTLHRLRDYLSLSRRLHVRGFGEVREVVVIGGGIHASETVESLLKRGLVVHWLLRGERMYSRVLDKRASTLALAHFRHLGAHIWSHTELVGIHGRIGSVAGVATTQHEYLPCQLVLFCTGTVPSLELAHACDRPLATAGGIKVDSRLATSLDGIYAAGDVAALNNPWTGDYETRAQWAAAVEQGRLAALSVTGHSEFPEHPFGTPWHATLLGNLSLLTVGMTQESSETEALTHEQDDSYYRMTVRQNQLVGYLALGPKPVDGVGIKRLIDEGGPWAEATKALLSGTFEAHIFFPQHHTAQLYAIGGITSGEPAGLVTQEDRTLSRNPQPSFPLPEEAGHTSHSTRVMRSQRAWPSIEHEIHACIGCNACLLACPALADPLNIDVLNQETLSGPISEPVIRFARACYQCGACVEPCPVGLHRDAMMLWLKVCLLRGFDYNEEGASHVAQ